MKLSRTHTTDSRLGDNTSENYTGTSSHLVAHAHTYATHGEYQITIRPNGVATAGWLDAFAFNRYSTPTSTTNYPADHAAKFLAINAPLTDLMRTSNATYRFGYMFNNTVNAIGIPSSLLGNINTSTATSFSYMFYATFRSFAYNSSIATIPEDLFDSLDTSSGVAFVNMLGYTFYGYAYANTTATIPEDLFVNFDTSLGQISTICLIILLASMHIALPLVLYR